ncbi:MAG: tripartite tricarboxylate transporter TctB family protein, partial [Burkholderiales bacterium]
VSCIVAAMLAFGFLMPRLGLVPALVAMFLVAALGGREFRWREVLVLTVLMTAFAVVVFVYVLKLPFQLFPGMYWV